MTALAKSAKTHHAPKKYCGWEEPAIYTFYPIIVLLTKVFKLRPYFLIIQSYKGQKPKFLNCV